MVFSSLSFLFVFLPVVFILYCLIPNLKAQNALLIVASLLFYAYGEPVYVLLMILSTIINFFGGLLVGNATTTVKRRTFVTLSIALNIGILILFKYSDMIALSINRILGVNLPLPQITLPIGISFFTFQAMSYVIDVYRRQVEPESNYFNVLLYISFFNS